MSLCVYATVLHHGALIGSLDIGNNKFLSHYSANGNDINNKRLLFLFFYSDCQDSDSGFIYHQSYS